MDYSRAVIQLPELPRPEPKAIPHPIGLKDANDFVAIFHRHCRRSWRNGGKFAIAAMVGSELVGVVICGRPVSRMLDDGLTGEVIRLCVRPGAPRNTCSMLYRAVWRAWRAMGGLRLVTYTLRTETGSSLRGAGFTVAAQVEGKQWSRPGRPRTECPIYSQPKTRWEIAV